MGGLWGFDASYKMAFDYMALEAGLEHRLGSGCWEVRLDRGVGLQRWIVRGFRV